MPKETWRPEGGRPILRPIGSSARVGPVLVLAAGVVFAAAPALAAPGPEPAPDKDRFVREDWIATVEPNRPAEWGDQWAINNFELPYRALIAGKHRLETRWFGNYRSGGETGGAKGVTLRLLVGTFPDFGLFMGVGNIHHQTGHDAAAREFSHEWGDDRISERFKQVLPRFLGGRELRTDERNAVGRGADANARANVQPMESENSFAYAHGREILQDETVNAKQVELYLAERGRFLMDYGEIGTLDQHALDSRACGLACGETQGPPFSTDFTQYLYNVNADRYGATRVDDFRLKMGDIKRAYYLQLADPLMWSALCAYGRDYVGRGSNTARLPMIPVADGWSYLPSLRVFFSPFGVEYFQDNYVRRRGVLTNVYWTRGDNKYERRLGGGFDVQNIKLPRRGRLELFLSLHEQPLLSRILGTTLNGNPLTPAEKGRTHLAYNVGGSVELPVWTFDRDEEDPRRLFLYARGGTKNLSWFPGDYFAAGTYLQTGLGLRL